MADNPHLDTAALLDKFGGDLEIVKELAQVAKGEFMAQLAALHESAQGGEAESIRKNAHALKTGLGSMEARQAYELARQVELAAKEGDVRQALAGMELLNQEMDELVKAMDSLGGGAQ